MLSKLIGMQIVEIDETKIIVKSENNEIYKIAIEDDSGDCCGYNEIVTNLFVEKNSNRNPIITNVEIISEENDEAEADEAIVVFYGENKEIAEISALSSSGSGWGYGANVCLVCKKLDINLMLTHY